MNLKDLLSEWGPNTEQFVIDENSVEYIWIFERKVTESESSTTGSMNSIKKALTKSSTKATATVSSSYGINTNASKYNLGAVSYTHLTLPTICSV